MRLSLSIRIIAAVVNLVLILAPPTLAYDDQLSAASIRDAYFLGIRQGGLPSDFLAKYSRWIPALKQWTCTSEARLETPFLHVADYISKVPNYSAQDAVKQFYDKPLPFRIHLDICYGPGAPPPYSVHIKIIQNRREIVPLSDQRSAYIPRVDEHATLPSNGEQIDLEFPAAKIDSSDLTIFIDTPDDQHATTNFDLSSLR
jgi:hypothetical protein